jgi:serine protein kinase
MTTNTQKAKKEMDFTDLLSQYGENYKAVEKEAMSLVDYLEGCKKDPSMYATAQQRLINAIGEPKLVDTSQDERLSKIFQNKVIKIYDSFENFYGMEDAIESIVSFLTRASQGLEERKQILYLLGPVGGGKSSLADRLKELMEQQPIYVLAIPGKDENSEPILSPVFESPLVLFSPQNQRRNLESFGIDKAHIPSVMSPWAAKRLSELKGIDKFRVVKLFPSALNQIAMSVTDPGDENNQDISTLVGSLDIHKVEEFSQNDADAYSYSGALCYANQGILEFREMFKAPLKTLHPLLFATQDGNYKGTEGISAIPFNGLVLAHSNESEWEKFSNNKSNEAFIDRVTTVKVPYCVRVSDEVKIYEKLLSSSTLSKAPCAPKVLETLAQFSVLTRMAKLDDNASLKSKMRVYNGESLKDVDPKAKSITEYRDAAGVSEGMEGMSTRFAFKILARTFNHDIEVSAHPIHLLYLLEEELKHHLEGKPEVLKLYTEGFIKDIILNDYKKFVDETIKQSFFEGYREAGQNIFDRYIMYARSWIDDESYRDPDTGQLLNRESVNKELASIEKPAGIANPKDFRHEVDRYVLKYSGQHNENPTWESYQKIKDVIEAKLFNNIQELMPVISFDGGKSPEQEKKHTGFLNRMIALGYTKRQVRVMVDFHARMAKSS